MAIDNEKISDVTKLMLALDRESQTAMLTSLIAGALAGAVAKGALAEFVCECTGALGVVLLLCQDDGPRLFHASRKEIDQPMRGYVDRTIEGAHDASKAVIDKIIAEIGGTPMRETKGH